MGDVRFITESALLAAIITVTGAIKLPGLMPGMEFQLSAPIAVAICAVFGFKKYIVAGMVSSVISLILGTHNLLNVAIAVQFRIIVGAVLALGQCSILSIILAGPLGTLISRLTLYLVIGEAAIGAVAVALPGMVLTAATAPMFTKVFARVRQVARM